jgi:hypothetical protein
MNFKFASIFDYDTIKRVREEINFLSQKDSEFKNHPILLHKIKKNLEKTHLE